MVTHFFAIDPTTLEAVPDSPGFMVPYDTLRRMVYLLWAFGAWPAQSIDRQGRIADLESLHQPRDELARLLRSSSGLARAFWLCDYDHAGRKTSLHQEAGQLSVLLDYCLANDYPIQWKPCQ